MTQSQARLTLRLGLPVVFIIAAALASFSIAARPAQAASTETAAAAAMTAPSVSTEAAVVRLSGLLIVGRPEEVIGVGTPDVKGVEVDQVPFLNRADFKARLSVFLGMPLDEAARNGIIAAIVRFCREQGRPLVHVALPPQEITGGVLQVLVAQSKVGRIKVEGNRWFSPRYVAGQLRARPGQDIDARQLGSDLDWLNRNPFRQVDMVYSKGAQLGQTDLVLREVDSFPVRFYGGYEDSGTPVTGENRLLAGVNWGNVLGYDGQMNYQYLADPSFKWMRAHSGSLVQPLPWRHIVTVFGSYADTHGDVAPPFDLKGFNAQASIRYEVPLPKLTSAKLSYQHSVVGGFDFKRGNNNLAFGGTQVFGAVTDTLQWSLGYNSSLKDPWGQISLRATFFYSPGHWTDNDEDGAYNSSRSGATARYTYANFELDRTTGLPWDFMLVNRCTFQASDVNLLASEQMGFGGYDTIRGYGTRVVNADQGYIISTELRTPPVNLLSRLGFNKVQDKFQFLGFFDYGSGSDRNLLSGEQPQTVLAGIGPGLRYSISTNVSLRVDYGWQLHNAETDRQYASRSHIGLVLSY
jgi:hemolysin activation/secretion protein